MKKSKKTVGILYSKELIDSNPKVEGKFKHSLDVFKGITDCDDDIENDYSDVLQLFTENLKKIGIKFPITITNLIALDEETRTTVLEFVTADDFTVKIVFKNKYYRMSIAVDQIIVERHKGSILITEKFRGFFRVDGKRILRFKSMEMNPEEQYVSSILSFIPETVQFEVENSMFFEVMNYYKYSFNEYLKFVNKTSFKEIKNANQLNQVLSNFFKIKSSFPEVFLFKEMNNGYNTAIKHFGVDYHHSLLKGFSGYALKEIWGLQQFKYAETFDEDITFLIYVEDYNVFLYLYQNGDWVITSKYDPRESELDTGEIVVRYPNLENFYQEKQLAIIAKAKKILKQNLSSFALKILKDVKKHITYDAKLKYVAYILRNLAEPQIFEN